MQFYLVSALVFSLLVAIFAVQNTDIVTIRFLTFQSSVSLVLVILGSAAIGALALFFLSLFRQVGNWMLIRQLTHQKQELEKQVMRLEEELKKSTASNSPEAEGQEEVKLPDQI